MAGLDGFTLTRAEIGWVGSGLERPECVLTTRRGDLYASDVRGGVSHLRADGSVSHYRGTSVTGGPLAANGFAMLGDGSFLIAPLFGGPVQRLHRDGRVEVFLAEADGRAICTPNFVLRDTDERIWICTRSAEPPPKGTPFSRNLREGTVILVDASGARIVAEGLAFPNEVRVDPTGRWLYTNETLAGGLYRHPIRADGSLGPAELLHQFGEDNVMDGFTFDAEGGLWLTAVVSNRIFHRTPDGRVRVVLDDSDPDQLSRLVQFQRGTGVPRDLLYEDPRGRMPNIASIAFGGPDLHTAYLGSLMGTAIATFRAPVAGLKPAHWDL